MTIKWTGLNELKKALASADRIDEVKEIVEENGNELEKVMRQKAVFGRFAHPSYTNGDTAGSIHQQKENGGLAVTVGPETEYSGYVELGTKSMAAQPFVKPALDEVKEDFIEGLKEVFK